MPAQVAWVVLAAGGSSARWRQNLFETDSEAAAREVGYLLRMEKVKTNACANNSVMEPRRPFDPLRPVPMEPQPAPFRPPGQYFQPRDDEVARILKEILDRLTSVENRLKAIEEAVKARR